jgi:hypothetical protein
VNHSPFIIYKSGITPADMLGVPRELTEHKLKVYPQERPIRQKLRRFMPDKREAIRAELARLV